jgi:GTP:adenosylcobinamide-phosphate guanylyltransferase
MESNKDLLTIIITASFIRSHPSIRIIKETIESLSLIHTVDNVKIILAHDYHNSNKYTEYFEKLTHYTKLFPHIEIIKLSQHGHLVGNIRNALSNITSKYILVIQHDLPFVKEFNIQKVIEDMEENPNIKYVRFNKRNNIKLGFDALNNLFGLQQIQQNYSYTRTPAWSDNNHICLTEYYKNIVMEECSNGRPMESILHGKNKNEETHKKYGTYLFGELNHPRVIHHIDGRNSK